MSEKEKAKLKEILLLLLDEIEVNMWIERILELKKKIDEL